MRTAIYVRTVGTEEELIFDLRRIVESRGDVVVSTFADDSRIDGKGKNAEWRRLLGELYQIDQVALNEVGDLPGRTVKDLLGILRVLLDSGVSLIVPRQNIDTRSGPSPILDLVTAYRRAKLSQAIRNGQAKARQAGKRIGRPLIPACVRRQIEAALAEGGGIRPTARRFNVSPASVLSIRRSMAANADRVAA